MSLQDKAYLPPHIKKTLKEFAYAENMTLTQAKDFLLGQLWNDKFEQALRMYSILRDSRKYADMGKNDQVDALRNAQMRLKWLMDEYPDFWDWKMMEMTDEGERYERADNQPTSKSTVGGSA